jgi:hypothetical protein
MGEHYAKAFKKQENQTVKEQINDTGPQRGEMKEGLYFGKGKPRIWGIIASLP